MNNVSLYSVTPETGGIFSALNNYSVPWKTDIDPELLDLQYYGNVSGEKIVSPLVYKNLDDDGKLTVSKQNLIASMIFKIYGGNWVKEWATLSKQYDPIANYDMTEVMENDETVIEYGKTEDTTTGNTHTKTGTETDTPDVTITTDDSIYGFNSLTPSNSNKRVEDPNGTNETEYDLSETDNGSVGLEQGGSDTHTRNYTLTRKGNIGVTTSQQLLQAERDLWMWNYFNDVVFPDVDRVMTIPIYAESTGYSGSSGGVTPTGTIDIHENGNQIDIALYAYADVNVPNSYTESDEGKVVSDGALVLQTSRTITENGTYDTTLISELISEIPIINILSGMDVPTSIIGNDGEIYLQYMSLSFDNSGLGWYSDYNTISKDTNAVGTISGRSYYKKNSDPALAAFFPIDGYINARYASTVSNGVLNTASIGGDFGVDYTHTIDGVTWYFSLGGYGYPARTSTVHSEYPVFSETFDLSTQSGAKAFLDAMGVTFTQPQLTETEITAAYLKVNGAWQNLIGSDINDVNR